MGVYFPLDILKDNWWVVAKYFILNLFISNRNDDKTPIAEFNHLGLITCSDSSLKTVILIIQEAMK